MLDAGVSPVGDPKLDLDELPGEGEPLKFAIEVDVLPEAKLGDYKGLEVGRDEPEVPKEAVDAELERLREGFAKLNPVDRAAKDGDVLLIDYKGKIDGEPFEGGEAKDYLLELGAGRVLPEFEQALKGAKAGDEKTATVTFPDDYQGEERRRQEGRVQDQGPGGPREGAAGADDDFAAEASEFDTLDELREHISERIREYIDTQIAERFRAGGAGRRGRERQGGPSRSGRPGAGRGDVEPRRAPAAGSRHGPERLSADAGQEPRGADRRRRSPSPSRRCEREAVLRAVADAEGIEVTEDDMLEALQIPPGHEDHGHPEPKEALEELRKSGRDEMLAEDLRMRRALETIAEKATPIPLEQAEATREDLDAREGARGEGRALDARVRVGPAGPRRRARSGSPGR